MNPALPCQMSGQGLSTLGTSSSSAPRKKRASSADGFSFAQQALEDKEAELSLLRARFNLRLDAERVKTQDASSALRTACEEATRSQQQAAVAELTSMRQSFDETVSLQRSTLEVALREERLRAAEAQASWQAEMAAMKRHAAGLEAELCAAQEAEQAQAAAEVEQRKRAEDDAAEMRSRLKSMQERLNESWMELKAATSSSLQTTSCSTQTIDDVREPPCSPQLIERMAMRLSDVEGEMWRGAGAESERLELVADRLRRAVALKNDTIDELKDELWRREREILEARGILSGLGEVVSPCS